MKETSTKYVKVLHEKEAAKGFTRHEHRYNKDDHKKVVEFVRTLNDERLRRKT